MSGGMVRLYVGRVVVAKESECVSEWAIAIHTNLVVIYQSQLTLIDNLQHGNQSECVNLRVKVDILQGGVSAPCAHEGLRGHQKPFGAPKRRHIES